MRDLRGDVHLPSRNCSHGGHEFLDRGGLHDVAVGSTLEDLGSLVDVLVNREYEDPHALALNRVDDETYGLCRDCDEPINPKRLEFDPTALRCIDCASNLEQ